MLSEGGEKPTVIILTDIREEDSLKYRSNAVKIKRMI